MTSLPEVVVRYQDAHDRRDTAAAVATFTVDAIVKDDSREYRGAIEIRDWLSRASVAFTYTRTLITASAVDATTWLVTSRLEGNFPGGVVDLHYRYVLENRLIRELDIAP
jgi:hypothetical protein